MMIISGKQCRLSRSITSLTVSRLSRLSGVAPETIKHLEANTHVRDRARLKIQAALAQKGVSLIPGGICLNGVEVFDHAAAPPKPLLDGLFTPRRDGRIVLLHPAAVRQARFVSGMTRGQVAAAVGVSLGTVERYESGEADLRLRPEVAERLWLLFHRQGVKLSAD